MLHIGVSHGEHVTVGQDIVVRVSHVVVGGSGGHDGGSHGGHGTVGHIVSSVVVVGGHVGVGHVGVGHVGFSACGHAHTHVKL